MFTDKNERKLAIARQLIADMPAYALDEAIDRIAYIKEFAKPVKKLPPQFKSVL